MITKNMCVEIALDVPLAVLLNCTLECHLVFLLKCSLSKSSQIVMANMHPCIHTRMLASSGCHKGGGNFIYYGINKYLTKIRQKFTFKM